MKPNKDINPITLFFPELSLASQSPRFQVIVTNATLEVLIDALIEVKCKNKKICGNYFYAKQLILLNEMGVISDNYFKLLKAFNDIRNEAAHGRFELTDKMLLPFEDMSFLIKGKDLHKPQFFQDLCAVLVCGFWNHHESIFGSYFDVLPATAIYPAK